MSLHRRDFLKLGPGFALLLSGCLSRRIDPFHVLVRSSVITSLEQENQILSKAEIDWSGDGRIRVLFVRGTPYERGYQHGALLRREVQDSLGYMYEQSLKQFYSTEFFAEAYERMRPFISQEYIEEMHGLAHGAKLPLEVVHHIHALPSISEWGGKSRIKEIVKGMIRGEFGPSCSNFCLGHSTTKDKKFYSVRILDWGLYKISKLQEYPLITVAQPDNGYAHCNIGWIGFIGAVSGINEMGITLGEMGYGDPPNETLAGAPMVFVLRDILNRASSLQDVRKILADWNGENSYGFLMSDGKSKESELYIKDRDRFLSFRPGTYISDGKTELPAIADTLYAGHSEKVMHELFSSLHGEITLAGLMHDIIPKIALKSNFHNVIYEPANLSFWVNNARSKDERAAEQPYTYFNFGAALERLKKRGSM